MFLICVAFFSINTTLSFVTNSAHDRSLCDMSRAIASLLCSYSDYLFMTHMCIYGLRTVSVQHNQMIK